ncbi:hypothetical protein L3Q82_020929 [Scortum barcoo]|uniref:Uncharacterized protein n=1 Tax=Scortum barcoo TaxID=214431 RepID=A0ACB8V970_9TELE|nr:hypothetical protein L3Q82_020929 [Scortum barcoo]
MHFIPALFSETNLSLQGLVVQFGAVPIPGSMMFPAWTLSIYEMVLSKQGIHPLSSSFRPSYDTELFSDYRTGVEKSLTHLDLYFEQPVLSASRKLFRHKAAALFTAYKTDGQMDFSKLVKTSATNLSGMVDWVMMQSCFSFHFMLVLQKKYDDQQFFVTVQLIGIHKQTETFAYRLELNRRRLTWKATLCCI